MRSRFGTFFMLLGTALVLAALSLFVYNQRESRAAEASAAEIMPQMLEYIAPAAQDEEPETAEAPLPLPDPYETEMTEVEIDGFGYIGYLSVPASGLELPVMAEWDYDRLKIAPCRYTGSTKTDDLVICAHNYNRHFGPIRNLSAGDEVYFTDMDGALWKYEVVTVEILAPSDVDVMSAGDYDLTLFTCTYGGASRVTVRCERAE